MATRTATARVLDRMAVPYKVDSRGRAERTQLIPTTLTSAGGLVTTVRDLAQLQFALDSYLLLEESTVAVAWNNAVNRRGASVPMGLGWFVSHIAASGWCGISDIRRTPIPLSSSRFPPTT